MFIQDFIHIFVFCDTVDKRDESCKEKEKERSYLLKYEARC